MKLIDFICQASGWTPVTRADGDRPHRDIPPGSLADVILVDPYDDAFRVLEQRVILSVRPCADSDCGHDFVEALIAVEEEYRSHHPIKVAAYRIVTKAAGTPEEILDKLEEALKTAKQSKKIDWTEIDGLIDGMRITCAHAAAIAQADAAWNSSSLYC